MIAQLALERKTGEATETESKKRGLHIGSQKQQAAPTAKSQEPQGQTPKLKGNTKNAKGNTSPTPQS